MEGQKLGYVLIQNILLKELSLLRESSPPQILDLAKGENLFKIMVYGLDKQYNIVPIVCSLQDKVEGFGSY